MTKLLYIYFVLQCTRSFCISLPYWMMSPVNISLSIVPNRDVTIYESFDINAQTSYAGGPLICGFSGQKSNGTER